MSRIRTYGTQRSATVARTINRVTVTASGPAEGELEVKYVERCEAYRAALRFRGEVYSGWGDTEDEAKRQVFESVAGLNGMLVADVQTEFYGDFEEPITIRRG
jgi:hypothetical protein